jgi:hypothetical protein
MLSIMGRDDHPERTERVSLAGVDPEEALRALLQVDPEAGDKEAKLKALRQATREELGVSGHRRGLRAEALKAGATPEEIEDAINTHPHREP